MIGKTILMIGIGWEQLELMEEAKRQGHRVIATHPYLSEEGIKWADQFLVKDSRDIGAHLELAKTHKIDAIITDNCDYSLYTASIIAQALKLPFTSIQSAIYSNNKFAQRKACQEANILQPNFCLVETLFDIKEAVNNLGFPVIVKPIDSRGTFGVTIVKEEEKLDDAFYEAIVNSPSRRLICEQFIEGTLVTVDGFCFKNNHQSLTVASRIFEKGEKPVTKEIVYPSKFSSKLNRSLLANHHKVVTSLGYQFGHTHGEYIVSKNNEIYLVECANRGGGVFTSSTIVPTLTNINLNSILINQSLGQDNFELSFDESGHMKNSVMLTFLDFCVGKVIKSINFEELTKKPYVLKYRTLFNENDMVESIENCASRHSMLVIKGKNIEETYKNLENFNKTLNIQYYNQ